VAALTYNNMKFLIQTLKIWISKLQQVPGSESEGCAARTHELCADTARDKK
jgi:hypothetical protein